MNKTSLSLCALCAFVGLSASGATTYLFNNFDGDASNDVGPGFQVVSNLGDTITADTTNTDPETGVLDFTRTSGNALVGFSSTEGLDLSAESSFTVTWVVGASDEDNDPVFSGWFFGVQNVVSGTSDSDNLWTGSNATSFGVTIGGTSANFTDGFDVVVSIEGTRTALTSTATAPTVESLLDGFTVIMTIDENEGWTVTTSGLSTELSTSGSLSAGFYASLASNLVASTALQTQVGEVTQGAIYDSISIVSVPEPGTFAQLGGLFTLAFVALRRRNS
jgi:hypothetical protein